ncbi:MAG TPA: amino acid adenylation domain-containing protein [Duganella sp.]|nr:amino acid adenylation domain-containing protein [Duganella sp.]
MKIEELIALCDEAGLELSVRHDQLEIHFDDEPTPQLLALLKAHKSELVRHLGEQGAATGLPIRNAAALSIGQQQLWFMEQIDGSTARYNLSNVFRFKGEFDESLAERAFGMLIERHGALRTTYRTVDGVVRQDVHATPEFCLDRIDLREVASTEREALVAQRISNNATQPFDLTAGPVVRAAVLRVGATEGVLLLTVHHIAADGWSLGLLVNEFGRVYRALAAGQQPELTPLALSYIDFANWQHELLQSHLFEARLQRYEERLKNLPLVHSLPLDYPRGQSTPPAGDVVLARISGASLTRLRDIGNTCGATLFMCLHAVFSIVLSRYSSESDIVMGTPVANRARKEFESLVGFFANTLVLRTTVTEELSFTEYLKHVRDEDLAALDQQDVPFQLLVERLNPPRQADVAPLFQVMLSMNNLEMPGFSLPGVDFHRLQVEGGNSNYDLALNAIEEDGSLALRFEYQTALFRRTTVEAFASCFCALIDQAAQNAERRVADLCWTDPATEDAWRASLDATPPAARPGPTLDQVFAARVAARHHGIAARFRDETISYGGLHARSEELAQVLRARGVGPDVLVGVFCDRSIGMIVALLAILKAGGAYVPLDPAYPDARLAHIVGDSGLGLLLTQSHLMPRCSEWNVEALGLDTPALLAECAGLTGSELPAFPRSDADLAYVIYTSGSTGQPKGVLVEHRNARHHLDVTCQALNAGDAVWLGLTTISFDISVLEIWGALLHGAHLVIAPDPRLSIHSSLPESHVQDVDFSLPELIIQTGVTHLQATPSLYVTLLSAPNAALALENLEAVLTGGEACSPDLATRLLAATKGKVYNMYGPTEATVWATYKSLEASQHTVTLGGPLPGYVLLVADKARRPCPLGMPGELLIAGPGVARGYHHRDQLTRERFILLDSPNGKQVRAYCTGDLVRYDHAGELHFVGRLDNQVKIHGLRVELGDIEAQLQCHPDLMQAACVVRSFGENDQRLCAYVVRHASAQGSSKQFIAELRDMLSETLPQPMVPAYFVLLDALPLMNNGKLDRKALPAPTTDLIAGQEQRYVAPATDAERTMIQLWADVLKLDPAVISADAGFFEIGGNSISLMLLLNNVQTRFGVALGVRGAFRDPSVKAMAAMVEKRLVSEACTE